MLTTPYNNQLVGANIRRERLSRNYCQDYMAIRLGISQNAYSKYELGHTQLKLERLFQIAGVFEMDAVSLMGPTTPPVEL